MAEEIPLVGTPSGDDEAVGDVYFNTGSYREAVDRYAEVNPDALTGSQAGDMLYRQAYSLLMLGDYDSASARFTTSPPTAATATPPVIT